MDDAGSADRSRTTPLRVLLVEDDPADVALIEGTFAAYALHVELYQSRTAWMRWSFCAARVGALVGR
ncbi:hypothetical protein [Micromonospora sp. NPDC051006]|uniref:hypothetical protein n=1 Tax=Micromonospora sp. NPDC051006 TaxID=3364283 RepID=UPI0037BBE52A